MLLRIHCLGLVLVACAISGLPVAGCAEVPWARSPMPMAGGVGPCPARLKEIEQALQHKQGLVACRALRESEAYVSDNPSLAKAIVARFPRYDGTFSQAFAIAALGNARGEAAQEVVRSYAEASSDKRGFLCCVFGRMGREALAAAPMLRQDLGNPGTDPDKQVLIRVALAAMGEASTAETDEIAQAIMTRGVPAQATLWAMMSIGSNEWVTEKIKEALVAVLDDFTVSPRRLPQADVPLMTIWVIGTLGKKADANVREALAKAVDVMKGNDEFTSEYAVGFLSLAKIDPNRRHQTLSAALSDESGPYSFYGGHSAVYLEGMCAGMKDEGFIRDVASFLATDSPRVCVQACNILRAVGFAASSATPQLVRIVESSRDDQVGEVAAEALAMVAAPSDVKELTRLAQTIPSSRALKRSLEEAIGVIELGVHNPIGN